MDIRGVVDELARGRVVEELVQNITRSRLTPELKDLCQMVYEIILGYDEDMIMDLWEHGQMRYFIARIVLNQYRSRNSPFHFTYRRYTQKAVDISELRKGDDTG